jgi:sRNA-binding protein
MMKQQNNLDMLAGIQRLAQAFPQAFFVYEARRRPLKIGIHQDILSVLGDTMDASELSAILRYYCGNRAYLRCSVAGAVRIDLDGSPAGEVTTEQAERAAKLLQRRASKASPKTAPVPQPEPASSLPSVAPAPRTPEPTRRLGLRDLKAAWAQRKAS